MQHDARCKRSYTFYTVLLKTMYTNPIRYCFALKRNQLIFVLRPNVLNFHSIKRITRLELYKMAKSCIFRSCNEQEYESIKLEDNIVTTVGRSIETKIIDKRCSKNQGNFTFLLRYCNLIHYFLF